MYSLNKSKSIIDSLMIDLVNSVKSDQINQTLYEAIEYVVNSGGKRIRPGLLLLIAKIMDVNEEEALICSLAIEIIHNYTLIHDDLPGMDDDDFRRGMPTCHKKFGEGIAILAGNGMYTLGLQVLMNGLRGQKLIEIMRICIDVSGISGILSGQANDIQLSDKENIITGENDAIDIFNLYYLKTGKLFEAVFIIPGILAGLNNDQQKVLSEAGSLFGVLYQLADDIADNQIKGNLMLNDFKESLITQFYSAIDKLSEPRLNVLKDIIKAIIQ